MQLYLPHVAATAQDKYGGKEQSLADVTLQSSRDEAKKDSLVEAVVSNPLPRRQGLPIVEDWDCLRVSSAKDSGAASQVLQAHYHYHAAPI